MAGVYDTLSRTQKLATFLIVIGPEAAAHVLRQFEDEEIELLCREMTSIRQLMKRIKSHRGILWRHPIELRISARRCVLY